MTHHNDEDEKRFAVLVQWQRFADLFHDLKHRCGTGQLFKALGAKCEFSGLYGYTLDGFAMDQDGPDRLCITVRTGRQPGDMAQICRNYRQFGEPFWTLDGPWWNDLPALTQKWMSALAEYRAAMDEQEAKSQRERHQAAIAGYLTRRETSGQ